MSNNVVRFILTGALLLSVSRAIGYWPTLGRTVQEPLSLGTADGVLLPAYVAAWTIAAAGCVWEIIRARLGAAFMTVLGLTWAWAFMWTIGGLLTGWPLWWQTAALYLGDAMMVSGLLVTTHRLNRTPEEEPPNE